MLRTIVILTVAMGIAGLLAPGTSVRAAPANDDFASATVVGALPYTTTVDTFAATLESGEPQSCRLGSKTAWFTFTAPAADLYEVDTFGSDFDTVLAVYTGSSVNALTEVGCLDDVPAGRQSRVQLQASAGTVYRIQVAGFEEAAGTLRLNVSVTPPPPPNDSFADASVIGALPSSEIRMTARATTEAAEPLTTCFNVGLTVWFEFTPPADGTYQIDTLASDFDTVVAVYSGSSLSALAEIACSDDVSVSIAQSRITASLTGGATYYVQAGGVSVNGWGLNFTDYGELVLQVTSSTSTAVDSDGDGCSDSDESGADPSLGGDRDPSSPWDFGDVPGPASDIGPDGKLLLSASSVRNRAVTLQDVGVVLAYVGRDAGDQAYGDDHNEDGVADGTQLDRTPSADPSKPWRSGPPNGAISLHDVGVMLAQVGHRCATSVPVEDSDGDGCSDDQELGADPGLGGDRDPLSAWDFYDVPGPIGTDVSADDKPILSAASARNAAVSLQDVGVVLAYVGRSESHPAYLQDNNGDGRADGEQLDRRPSIDPSRPWRSGAPNGGVNLQDVGVALAQVGHTCATP